MGNESRVYLFVKVFWFMLFLNVYRFYCGKLVEIWKKKYL